MKQNTSTPSFLSLRITEGQNTSPLEWSSDFYFNQEQHQFCKFKGSPSPPTTGARRVSTVSSETNESSSELSCIPSSVSVSSTSLSSIGGKSNDGSDQSFDSSCASDEDGPIISFEALSLDTQLGSRTGKALFKSKSSQSRMNLPHKNDQDQVQPPIESLNLASSFEGNARYSLSRRRPSEKNNVVPFGQSSDDSNAMQQRRRATSKKYTVRKSTTAKQSTFAPELEAQKVPRAKRERGGSDFTMASASDGSAARSKSSPRKRRRVNRNRAMAAEDFNSILSQINTTGSLEGI